MNKESSAIAVSRRIANLPPEKLALLMKRMQKGSGNGLAPVIPRRSRVDAAPLSFAQQRLWFLDQMDDDGSLYVSTTCLRVNGPLDVAKLEATINEVVRRHEILRTAFPAIEGKPIQVVAPQLSICLPVTDLSGYAELEREVEVRRLAQVESERPFDLATGPLVRVSLLRLGPEEHVALLSLHHIISDWWSMTILIREVSHIYERFSSGEQHDLPDLPIQYSDYASWQREQLQGDVLDSHLSYWKTQLAGTLPVLNLPSDRVRPAVQRFVGAYQHFRLSQQLSESLAALCRNERVTLFMVLLAGFAALLQRYTDQTNITVGTDIANRTHSETESLIGFFINQLVLKMDVSGDPTFRELLVRCRDVALGAYAHQDLPFEQLVAQLQPERSLSHTPLFQVKFVLQNAPAESIELRGTTFETIDLHNGTVGFDLILAMMETPEGLKGTLEYSADLFDHRRMSQLLGHFETLLESATTNPDLTISQLKLLTDKEQNELLVDFNNTTAEFDRESCIHEIFEEHVELNPEAVAVTDGQSLLTYEQLNKRANQLAHYLRLIGVGPEARVAICLPRSRDMIVALLGVLKAGGTYLPINPSYPFERLSLMLEDAQAAVLITQEALLDELPAVWSQVVCLDRDSDLIETFAVENLRSEVRPDNAAYVIYTSGSTGNPKGVVIEHRGVVNLGKWQASNFQLTKQSRISQFASYSFDAAVGETFMALLNGATLVMLDREDLSPARFMAQLNDLRVTVVVIVPSLLKELDPNLLANSEVALVAVGEACAPELASRWADKCRFMNAYGPTEYTVYSHLWKVDKKSFDSGQPVPIGTPIHNAKSYILDSQLNPVALGNDGEIYLTGPGIARGYLNRAEITAERFLPNPFHTYTLFIDHGRLQLESAVIEIETFNSERQTASKSSERKAPFRWSKAISTETVFSLVRGLDTDLIDKTHSFVTNYSQQSAAYQAFCRYLIEGFNNTYSSAGINAEILRTLLPYSDFKGLHGVEFGFGNGEVLCHLSRLGASMTGLDFNPFFVKKGREMKLDARMARIDVAPDQFLAETGIAERSQDFAISTLLLDRLEEPKNSLKNLFLILKDGGRFAIQTLLPIVGTDDGVVETPIVYTPAENRLTPGIDASTDQLSLVRLLHEYGAAELAIYQLPYVVSSRDGIQQYTVWSFTGRKRVDGEDRHGDQFLRMYKTGDRARYLPNGALDFRGRIDNQVKVRGFRIELGEVESTLSQHPGVKDCVVDTWEIDGQKRLVAYAATFSGESKPSVNELQDFLRQRLPEHMVPSAFQVLDSLPLTPNGKVDRQKLPSPMEVEQNGSVFEPPRNRVEMLLAEAWSQVLGVKRIGIHENIFDLGGDSILIIQILARISQVGLHLTVNQFFKHQTIAELAAVASTARVVQAEQTPVTGRVPLTPVQRWFLEQELIAPHHYNQSVLLQLKDEPDVHALAKAATNLIAHHDALRLRFSRLGGKWHQFNADLEEHDVLCQEDFSALSDIELTEALKSAANRYQASLNLTEGPLMRVVLFRCGPSRRSRLLIIIHHLVVDGLSWRILVEDFQTSYRQLLNGEPVRLPLKTTSFKHWAERLETYAQSTTLQQEADYWLKQTESTHALPVDYPNGSNLNSDVCTVSTALSRDETRNLLEDVPSTYGTQINEVLLTGLGQALQKWLGSGAVLVDVEGHGREELSAEEDVTRTVGWFTSLYPVRLQLNPAEMTGDALKRVKEQLRAVPSRGLGYGLLKYLGNQAVSASLRRQVQSQVSFNYLGQFDHVLHDDSEFEAASEGSGKEHDERQARPYFVEVSARIAGGQLHLDLSYSQSVHSAATINRLKDEYVSALRGIIEHCQSPGAGGYTPSDFPLAKFALASLSNQQLDQRLGTTRQLEDVYPLTPLQKGFLFHNLYNSNSRAYFNQMSAKVLTGLQPEVFMRAWSQVISHYPILRTSFTWEGLDEPLQLVHKNVSLPILEEDWSELSQPEQEETLRRFLEDDRSRGFDLQVAPLMRVSLFRLSEESYYLVWSFHHLLMDGWSVALMLRDLFRCYEGMIHDERTQLERGHRFSEYVEWLYEQDMNRAEEFWRERLKGFNSVTQIGTSFDEYQVTSNQFSELSVRLSEEKTNALNLLARRHRLTVNTIVQGSLGILLGQYSGQDDVVFGTVVAGRPPALAGADKILGLFINTLPVRIRIDYQQSLWDWLEQLQEQQAELRQFEFSPLASVQGWSEAGRGRPLFEIILIFENYPVDESLKKQSGILAIEEVETWEQTNYPLTIAVAPNAELTIKASFDEKRFQPAVIERMLAHLQTLLERISTQPDQLVGELPLLNPAEQQQILVEWNDTESPYPDVCLHKLFEDQVTRTPDAVALVTESERINFSELNRRSNQLAHHLADLGVGAESCVAVCLERSAEMIVALLAVLKAGGAYLPLDPSYPSSRLSFMLENSRASVLLTVSKLLERLPASGAQTLCLDTESAAIATRADQNPRNKTIPSNAAYVIYTSGSTGKPKAVISLHQGAVNRLQWMWNTYPFDQDICSQKTSIGFADSVWEIFGSLLQGIPLVVIPDDVVKDPRQLVRILGAERVTRIVLVPTLLRAILETDRNLRQSLPDLKYWTTSGEALPPDLASQFSRVMPGCVLINLYGASEVSADVTCCEMSLADEGESSCSIGRPIANTQIYILNARLDPVAAGVIGEIYVGGDNLARGYLWAPDLTAERFIPDPFSRRPGGRLYRTGDLGRWQADGQIEYLGRIDHQVKLRGNRIELSEIECALGDHPAVREVAAVAREDQVVGRYLAAYYVCEPGAAPSSNDLRSWVRARLPEIMVPSVFMKLESLPLTPSGKLDRKALPDVSEARREKTGAVPPRTDVERTIAAIWQQVLGIEQVGIDDNFFDLGGHSLLLIKVQSLLRKSLAPEILLVELFRYSTVNALAEHLSAAKPEEKLYEQSAARGMKRRTRRNR